ncbi:MAG TPA: hypothetical protein VGN38_08015 [Caulobacteraceae bacterium]|jgi:hypothetical protein|nr:hypothetical protein [Caulobacteraceae bacterium]
MPSSPLSLAATALIALGGAITGLAASAQMAPGTPPPSASTPMPGSGSMDEPPAAPTPKGANAQSPKAQTGAAANTSAAVPLADGMTVRDNTGASIGIISKMAADASGGQMVTIKMGADAFQVPAANLAVNNGAAEINLTKAQIEAQLHPAAPK